jgi:hypothetical protein
MASHPPLPIPESLTTAEGPVEVGTNTPWPRRPNMAASARRPADTRRARPNWQRRQ